jgi:hypothetical protein
VLLFSGERSGILEDYLDKRWKDHNDASKAEKLIEALKQSAAD